MITTGEYLAKCKTIDKLKYIRDVLPFIEKYLAEELKPELIAGRHFVSLRQLYRDFYAYTGHSVKEYIRKRRISNACEKIKCSDIPLAIVADESGCQTQQAFHKQFKSIVGMTPLEYKQGDAYFYFYPFSFNEISLSVKVGNEEIPECTTERFYDSCLIGIEDKAIANIKEINGRVFGRNGKQIGNRFCYEVMTENVENSGGKKNDLHSLKEQLCCSFATCIVNYNEEDINNGWNYLYNIWLPASMFEQSGDGYFEEYLFKSGNNPHKLKLYLPVKKRRTSQHITISQLEETSFITAREKGADAERRASEKVMRFLQEYYPLLVMSAQHFYVCSYDDICECGVQCGGDFKLPQGIDLEVLNIPAGEYAVLPDDCLGDIRIGCAKMDLWLQNNSIPHEDRPAFAIYETRNGKYDAENIQMKLYRQLKNDKNG